MQAICRKTAPVKGKYTVLPLILCWPITSSYTQTDTHLAVLEVSCFAVVGAGAWVQQGVVDGGQDLLATSGPLAQALLDPASSYAARTVTPPLVEHSAAHAHRVRSCIYHQNGNSLLSTCSNEHSRQDEIQCAET